MGVGAEREGRKYLVEQPAAPGPYDFVTRLGSSTTAAETWVVVILLHHSHQNASAYRCPHQRATWESIRARLADPTQQGNTRSSGSSGGSGSSSGPVHPPRMIANLGAAPPASGGLLMPDAHTTLSALRAMQEAFDGECSRALSRQGAACCT